LALLLVNVVDFSMLIWDRMQVDDAAEVGSQAAYKSCVGTQNPFTTNCSGLNSIVATAVQSTSLGNLISVSGGAPSETYYCLNGTSLVSVGTAASPPNPFDCTAAGSPGVAPGDYLTVTVSYAYAPIFAGLSLASSQTLQGTGMQRLQ
jgi:hypothetical protein